MTRLFLCLAALAALGLHHLGLADTIVHTEKSLYRNIAVFDDDGIRCLRFTVKRQDSRQSCIDLSDPDRLVLPYTPVVFAGLLLNPAPERVLIIGLGGGTLANVFTALFPGIAIDAVEVDPAVIRVAEQYFNFRKSDETRVYAEDGRVFVRRALRRGDRYDFIVLDAFTGEYIPEHMMTAEFLEQCRLLLSDAGVLVGNTFSTSRLYDSESATYDSVFGEFLNLRRRFSNRVIVAGKTGLPSLRTMMDNHDRVKADLDRFDIDLENLLSLDRGRDWRRKARILTDQYAPANLLRASPKP